MPYSISYLKSFLQNNLTIKVQCLDLNAQFHVQRFPSFYQKIRQTADIETYGKILSEFENNSREVYAQNHKRVIANESPELISEMIELILREKPTLVALSLVYNSQCFYGKALLKELGQRNIKCIIGGPSASHLQGENVPLLKNEIELLNYVVNSSEEPIAKFQGEEYNYDTIPDFSDFPPEDYLSRERIIPLKTSSTCFYKQCTFCTHYADVPYFEFSLDNIRKTIQSNKAQHLFFIDDMISKQRLLQLAEALKSLKVTWWCQLRPTKELILILPDLYASGLRAVCWGVESGNQRILDLMKKGTKVQDAALVLQESHSIGIKNMLYIMFGFPSETKEEFLQTLTFLKTNSSAIDLVCTNVFGLQKRSPIFKNPDLFGIKEVKEQSRTILSEKIMYRVESGLQNEEAKKMRKRYRLTLRRLNKLPTSFDYFKEQVLVFTAPPLEKGVIFQNFPSANCAARVRNC